MRPAQCDRPSLHAVVAAGLSILVVTTAVPLDVIVVVVVDVAVVVVAVVVVVVSSASGLGGDSRWVRTWHPLVAATLLTRAHLPPRGDIARFYRVDDEPQSHGHTHCLANANRSYLCDFGSPGSADSRRRSVVDPEEPALLV